MSSSLPKAQVYSLRVQLVWFACLSGLVVGGAAVLTYADAETFQRFFGSYSPVLVVSGLTAIGAVLLVVLNARAEVSVVMPGVWGRGGLTCVLGGTLFVVPTILVDLLQPFPEDLNVGLPLALLYYPVMGFVVEVVFHLLPLVIVHIVLSYVLPIDGASRRFWVAASIAAALEPVFQIWVGVAREGLTWKSIYLGGHLFFFGLVQLYVLRSFGFVQMYLFRMIYYLHWHILWGTLRLWLLF